MKSFNWNSNYETGIEVVDAQHKSLVNIINEYSDYLSQNNTTDSEIAATLAKLVEYTEFHFREEEALMDSVGIDSRHTLVHKELHRDLIREIALIKKSIIEGNRPASRELLDLIIHWLAYHILGTDKNMSRQISAVKSGLSASEAFEQEEREANTSTEPLIDALNGLFKQISTRNHQLNRLNQHLEDEVQARTQELLEANQRLEMLSLTDPLTAMFNRRYAMQQLSLLWQESNTHDHPISCLMIDADYFKQINDSYGHDIGDNLLVALANTLKDSTRSDDVACRLGGDEFLIICPNTDLKGGLHLAEQVAKSVAQLTIPTSHKVVKVSLSIGVAVQAKTMDCFEELIKAADKSVYLAKEHGRGCIKSAQADHN